MQASELLEGLDVVEFELGPGRPALALPRGTTTRATHAWGRVVKVGRGGGVGGWTGAGGER
jgi:hypothetical protein